jgi:hypothetical protein
MYRTFVQDNQDNVIGINSGNLTNYYYYYPKNIEGEQPKVFLNIAEKADWLA